MNHLGYWPALCRHPRKRTALIALLIVGACWALVGFSRPAVAVTTVPSEVAPAADQQVGTICNTVTAIPQSECEALVALFIATKGSDWINRSGWGVQPSPCDWFGIGCAGGHVVSIELPRNRLDGTLPERLGDLTHLNRLILNSNRLGGTLPHAMCDLVTTVTQADLAYNLLEVANRRVKQCVDALDPGWETTQTVPPRDLTVTSITTDTVSLTWRPIFYTGDGGYYVVAFGDSPAGPFTPHGVTADKSATGYVVDGLTPGKTYFIRVRTFTPSHAAHPADLTSGAVGTPATTQADGDPLLVLIYFPADNDLSPYVDFVLQRIRRGTAVNPNVQVLFLADKLGDNNTALFEVAQGVTIRTSAVADAWGKDELDTTDPAVLSWFLNYGRTRFPASRTVVSLMGHGMGMMPDFGWIVTETAETSEAAPAAISRIPPLPRGIEATPGDYFDNGSYMSTVGFAQALAAATQNGANPFDMVFFDQCFQGNLDVLYEVRRYADVLIASPNYAWLAAPYHQYMAVFSPAATTEEMAQSLIRIYESALTDDHPNAIFWLRSADLDPIVAATNQLAQALRTALAAGRELPIAQAAENAAYVDTTQCGPGKFKLEQPDELMSAASFARNLRDGFAPGDADGIHAAASDLLTALDAVSVAYRAGNPYIAPDEFWDYRDSLTLLAPLQRDAASSVAWRASIYAKEPGLTAVWSPTPSQTVYISQTLAFAAEGAWSDFIADWYTQPLTPTLGEWCQYIPPALVTGDTVEALNLALDPGALALTLSWTPTAADEATAYWILARGAQEVNWVVMATVPIGATVYDADLPAAGSTTVYAVVAQDDLGLTLAASNEVDYTAPPQAVELYLPQMVR